MSIMISEQDGWVKLGEGSQGKVLHSQENRNIVRKEALDESCNNFIEYEYQCLIKFDKPFIRKAFNYRQVDTCSFEMEYYGKTLEKTNGKIDEFDKFIMIYGVAKAVECISNQNLIHRDIKPCNIMLNTKNYPVLSDFGLSRELKYFNPIMSRVGTPIYTKPLFKDLPNVADVSVDIYSIGVLVYDLFFGIKKNCKIGRNITKSAYYTKRKEFFDQNIDNGENDEPYIRLFRMCCDIENKCTLRDVFDSLDQIRNQKYGDKLGEFDQFQRWLNGEINVKNYNENDTIIYSTTDSDPKSLSVARNTK